MITRNEKLAEYLQPGKHVHLVGIGGVSMRPLALVLKDRGIHVTGSDMNSSGSTEELLSHGIPVAIALILYGVAFLLIERYNRRRQPRVNGRRC